MESSSCGCTDASDCRTRVYISNPTDSFANSNTRGAREDPARAMNYPMARPEVRKENSHTPATRKQPDDELVMLKGMSLVEEDALMKFVPSDSPSQASLLGLEPHDRRPSAPLAPAYTPAPISTPTSSYQPIDTLNTEVHMRLDVMPPSLPPTSLMEKYMYYEDDMIEHLRNTTTDSTELNCLAPHDIDLTKRLTALWFPKLDTLGWFWVHHINYNSIISAHENFAVLLRNTKYDEFCDILTTKNGFYDDTNDNMVNVATQFRKLHKSAKSLHAAMIEVCRVPYGIEEMYNTSTLINTFLPSVARAFYTMVTRILAIFRTIESCFNDSNTKEEDHSRLAAYLMVVLHSHDHYFDMFIQHQLVAIIGIHEDDVIDGANEPTFIDWLDHLDPFLDYKQADHLLYAFSRGLNITDDGQYTVHALATAPLPLFDPTPTQEDTIDQLLASHNVPQRSHDPPSSKMYFFVFGDSMYSSKKELTLREFNDLLDQSNADGVDYTFGNVDFMLKRELLTMWTTGKFVQPPRYVETVWGGQATALFASLQEDSGEFDSDVQLLGTWDEQKQQYAY